MIGRRGLLAGVAGLGTLPAFAAGTRRPIFDAHIHYSHDAVIAVPPAQAVAVLRAAGLMRALVSSSDDEGTQKLHALAPDIVIPVLRPYRRRSDLSGWTGNPDILEYENGGGKVCHGSGGIAPLRAA